MARKAKELSAFQVARLRDDGAHAVGGAAGLVLQVRGDSRSWVLRATMGERRRWMGLGSYDEVSLADARAKAAKARQAIDSGIDPLEQRRRAKSALVAQQAAALRFADACSRFIDAHSAEWSAGTLQQWTAMLEAHAKPVLGQLLAGDIKSAHVLAVLRPIWHEQTATAQRVRSRIAAVLDWCTALGYREGPNPARWVGHLDHMLAAPEKITATKHHKALAVQAVPAFMVQLRKCTGDAARCLEFAVLTAGRSNEVRGALWAEIDLDKAEWCIPAERMKLARPHRVPLSPAALDVLHALPRREGDDLVFRAPRGGMLTDKSLSRLMVSLGADAVPHGLRSTFTDWAAEHTHHPHELVEMALSHAVGSATERAYRRGDQLGKRAALMADWAAFCGAPAARASNVHKLKAA